MQIRHPKLAMTGANGYVGRNIGKSLQRKGFDIIGVVRRRKSSLVTFGVSVISNDLSEKYLVSRLKGCYALLHLIGKGRQTIDADYEKVNVLLTKRAIELCKKAGIKKIIYISGLGVSKSTSFGYFISKLKAENEIIESSLDYTIFRASYIIGRGDPLSQILVKQTKNGTITIAGSGNYRIQPIFVDDVAEVFAQSILNKKFSRKVIDLVGPKIVTYNRFLRDIVSGKKVRIKKIPLQEAYYDALHNPRSMFGLDDLNILVGDFVGDHKKLRNMTGIKFKTYHEVLKSGTFP